MFTRGGKSQNQQDGGWRFRLHNLPFLLFCRCIDIACMLKRDEFASQCSICHLADFNRFTYHRCCCLRSSKTPTLINPCSGGSGLRHPDSGLSTAMSPSLVASSSFTHTASLKEKNHGMGNHQTAIFSDSGGEGKIIVYARNM